MKDFENHKMKVSFLYRPNLNNLHIVFKQAIQVLSSRVTDEVNIKGKRVFQFIYSSINLKIIHVFSVPKNLPENEFFCGFKPVTEWSSEKTISDLDDNVYRLKTILILISNLNNFYTGVLETNNEEITDSTLMSLVSK